MGLLPLLVRAGTGARMGSGGSTGTVTRMEHTGRLRRRGKAKDLRLRRGRVEARREAKTLTRRTPIRNLPMQRRTKPSKSRRIPSATRIVISLPDASRVSPASTIWVLQRALLDGEAPHLFEDRFWAKERKIEIAKAEKHARDRDAASGENTSLKKSKRKADDSQDEGESDADSSQRGEDLEDGGENETQSVYPKNPQLDASIAWMEFWRREFYKHRDSHRRFRDSSQREEEMRALCTQKALVREVQMWEKQVRRNERKDEQRKRTAAMEAAKGFGKGKGGGKKGKGKGGGGKKGKGKGGSGAKGAGGG